ncbi:murein L,D-transpeptidase catalytic domain family protein [Hymenobacter sublimis]|uniref:Murein L,D-transpeptidase catalytic domain family protein n=1 Tax=Hymenobacter sublimis TaxID=2933777 RepID=A0ABY4J6I8_9BACT|nr:murein L,D-transpeptidase catalytic domain family protein [Hymenobacter sublimis]UPL48442.1 murein L,D-transpeptidase catalytic domain family protein [Hymenobacter sublimis]
MKKLFSYLATLGPPTLWGQLRHYVVPMMLSGVGVSCQSSVGEAVTARLPPAPRVQVPAIIDSARAVLAVGSDSMRLNVLAPLPDLPDSLRRAVQVLHAQLGPAAHDLRLEVLERACVGYLNLRQEGLVRQAGVLTVADMDLPSSKQRLWVLDLAARRVLHHSHVAHGRGSGQLRARRFSNVMKSACTALGFYRTQDSYQGRHGLSRRLRGLDANQNDNALRRYVVLHAADYVSQNYIAQNGQAGYSRGCPALPPEQYKAIIHAVGEGSCLYLSGPGATSKWLNGTGAAQRLAAHGWR